MKKILENSLNNKIMFIRILLKDYNIMMNLYYIVQMKKLKKRVANINHRLYNQYHNNNNLFKANQINNNNNKKNFEKIKLIFTNVLI